MSKNLTLTLTVLAKSIVSVKRKPNKVIKNRWKKNSKDIPPRRNNMNSTTLMIRRVK